MTKYHISNGTAKSCNATINACPISGDHYDNLAEANEARLQKQTDAQTPALTPVESIALKPWETDQRAIVKANGGRWDSDAKVWRFKDGQAGAIAAQDIKILNEGAAASKINENQERKDQQEERENRRFEEAKQTPATDKQVAFLNKLKKEKIYSNEDGLKSMTAITANELDELDLPTDFRRINGPMGRRGHGYGKLTFPEQPSKAQATILIDILMKSENKPFERLEKPLPRNQFGVGCICDEMDEDHCPTHS